ncbi:MAG: hypothetical protein KIS62_15990 [Ramlibacter sp.]|nr:hypothetical protein [Ramlibacter sp.]
MQTFSLANSVLAGAITSVTNASSTLRFITPLTAATVKVCVVQKPTVGFPDIPPALTAMLTGSVNWAVLADGQIDLLSNKQLTINSAFSGLTADQLAAKKVVAYTPTSTGGWVRTALATTQRAGSMPVPANFVSIEFTAPITGAGFFTVE